MNIEGYFGKWLKWIDRDEVFRVLSELKDREFFPEAPKVFRVFRMVDPDNVRAVILGQDPYPTPGTATGVAFANDKGKRAMSASLRVLKNSVCLTQKAWDRFDTTLEMWTSQGIMPLNIALTVKPFTPGSHVLLWRAFTLGFLESFRKDNPKVPFVAFGSNAAAYARKTGGVLWEERHPSAIARSGERLSTDWAKALEDEVERSFGQAVSILMK